MQERQRVLMNPDDYHSELIDLEDRYRDLLRERVTLKEDALNISGQLERFHETGTVPKTANPEEWPKRVGNALRHKNQELEQIEFKITEVQQSIRCVERRLDALKSQTTARDSVDAAFMRNAKGYLSRGDYEEIKRLAEEEVQGLPGQAA